jgi:hypothetical protein
MGNKQNPFSFFYSFLRLLKRLPFPGEKKLFLLWGGIWVVFSSSSLCSPLTCLSFCKGERQIVFQKRDLPSFSRICCCKEETPSFSTRGSSTARKPDLLLYSFPGIEGRKTPIRTPSLRIPSLPPPLFSFTILFKESTVLRT